MMGLSEMKNDALNQLRYAKHVYLCPSFGVWHEWFAWYPVKVVKFKEVEMTTFGVATYYLKVYNWAWLKKVARRKVIDCLDGPGRETAGKKTYYEYTSLLEILKNE